MTIVAHQDDDFLFMNPDIDRGIAAGLPHVTVYVTAGDAGEGEAYWRGREVGAKAAYALMAGSDTWVDETVTLDLPGGSVSVSSSYLADHPAVRIYFLRLPDGGGTLSPEQEQQLARLESGDLASVTAIDGSATYSRADLVAALTALMTRHSPTEFRLQLHEGDTAPGDHTDHLHSAEFSEEALAAYSGGVVTVTHYINYDSRLMPENLTSEESARALAVMQAYAAHDPFTQNEDGSLQQVYVDWTRRQYIAETYTLDTNAPPPAAAFEGGLAPVWGLAGDWDFSLTGPDSHLFTIGTVTGAVSVQDWFSPDRTDAWDSDGDHIYEVTRLATPQGGGAEIPQAMRFEAVTGGGLTLLSADAVSPTGDSGATGATGGAGSGDGGPAEDGGTGTGGEAAADGGDGGTAEDGGTGTGGEAAADGVDGGPAEDGGAGTGGEAGSEAAADEPVTSGSSGADGAATPEVGAPADGNTGGDAGQVTVDLTRIIAGTGPDGGGGDGAVALAASPTWDEADEFDFVAPASLTPALALAEGGMLSEGSVLMQALGGAGPRWSPAQEAEFLLILQAPPDTGGGMPEADSLL